MSEPFLSPSWYRVAPLRPVLREQAKVSRHRYWGQSWYVVSEPASGRVHRFTPAAYDFIRAMDGRATVDQIWMRMAAELADGAPSQNDIIRLLSQLFEADLLQVDRMPHAEELARLISRRRHVGVRQTAGNPLVLTVPLWDPDKFLGRTLRYVGPAIGWVGLMAWCVLVAPAIVLALLYSQDLTQSLTDRVLSAQGLLLIALVYPVVKAAHELGHAYAVKALGGEVHQLGVMLIGFYPVPFVDASAASVFPSKYQRAFVGAAGMMVELALAAIALYVWITVEPGVLRAAMFDVILIAGVSTLLVNGNPLLRFDGYYILSDLIEIPNLAPRSSRYWRRVTQQMISGEPSPERAVETPRESIWFLLYGPASYVYKLAVLIAISIFLSAEYFVIGALVAVAALIAGIVLPLWRGVRRAINETRTQAARRRVARLLGAGTLSALILALAVPLPLHTNTEGVFWLPEEAYVRARADGFIERLLRQPGERVTKGDFLAQGTDPLLEMEIRTRRLRILELEARLSAALFADRVQAEIERRELEEEQQRLASDLERSSRLKARSEYVGVFVAPKADDLPGRFFRKGEVLGYVLPDSGNIIRAIISQDDVDLVRHRLREVRIVLVDNLLATIGAKIVREVPAANDELPSKALAAGGGGVVPADPKDPKGLRSLRRMFQIDLRLEQDIASPAFGARALVRFEHAWEPLASQAYRRLRQLFLARFNA